MKKMSKIYDKCEKEWKSEENKELRDYLNERLTTFMKIDINNMNKKAMYGKNNHKSRLLLGGLY